MTAQLSMSPLQLDPLSRDYWGHFDAWLISQYAPLFDNECYSPSSTKPRQVPMKWSRLWECELRP